MHTAIYQFIPFLEKVEKGQTTNRPRTKSHTKDQTINKIATNFVREQLMSNLSRLKIVNYPKTAALTTDDLAIERLEQKLKRRWFNFF